MGAVARMQIEELANRNEEPGWFESVCAEIANGASVDLAYAKLCNDYAVSWGAFRTWVKADVGREQKYQEALAARLEYRRERAAANVAKIAAVDHDDAKVSVPDTLKAAGIVLDAREGESKGTPPPISISIAFVDAADGRPVTVNAP